MVSLDPEHGIVSFRQRKTGTEIVIGLHEDLANWLAGIPRRMTRNNLFFLFLPDAKPPFKIGEVLKFMTREDLLLALMPKPTKPKPKPSVAHPYDLPDGRRQLNDRRIKAKKARRRTRGDSSKPSTGP